MVLKYLRWRPAGSNHVSCAHGHHWRELRSIAYWRPLERDEVMNKIQVGNITKLNDLVYASTVVITEMLGAKN